MKHQVGGILDGGLLLKADNGGDAAVRHGEPGLAAAQIVHRHMEPGRGHQNDLQGIAGIGGIVDGDFLSRPGSCHTA